MRWRVAFRIHRYKQDGSSPYYQAYKIDVKPDEYVLDAIEKIWAEQDRSLTFRHACHHAACGACGMRINGREKLTCTTQIDSITSDGGSVLLEPMRNLPVVSDLVVDMTSFYLGMEEAQFVAVRSAEPMIDYVTRNQAEVVVPANRFENCIECALCYSACPIPATNPEFLGPASLAAIGRMVEEPRCGADPVSLLDMTDNEKGLWRCHSAFECVDVCPADVNPGGMIMMLRRQVIIRRFKQLFGFWS
jgi:succinate dehydrogenase / fumarate reductase, iron-sulfur subunit